MGSRKALRFPIALTDHAFDKVRAIDLTLAEFEELLDSGEIIEERALVERSTERTRAALGVDATAAHRGDRRRAAA